MKPNSTTKSSPLVPLPSKNPFWKQLCVPDCHVDAVDAWVALVIIRKSSRIRSTMNQHQAFCK